MKNEIKTINLATSTANTSEWYLTTDGDVVETLEEAEYMGIEAKIIADGFYVGSLEDWMASIKESAANLR